MRHVVETHGYSERRACKLMDLNRRTYRREPAPDRNADLRIRLKELAEERRRFGSPRLLTLLRREGWVVNHKRVERVYRQEGLSLRQRRRRKRPSHLRHVRPGPTGANQHWAMDFVSDSLADGQRMRVLTVVDLWDRRSPCLETDRSITGERVARRRYALRLQGQCPQVIRVDNGPEFTSKAVDRWAHEHGVRLEFIHPGKPTDNSSQVSTGDFGTMFTNLSEAKKVIEEWRQDYNTLRPHDSLGGMSPDEYRRASTGVNLNPESELKCGIPGGVRSLHRHKLV